MKTENSQELVDMEKFLFEHCNEGINRDWIAKFYQDIHKEISEDPDLMEEDESFLSKETESIVLSIINSYKQAKKLGHSDAFSKVYAEVFYMEEDESRAKFTAYNYLRTTNKNLTYLEINELVYEEAYYDWLKQGENSIESKKYAQEISAGEFEHRATDIAKQYYSNYSRSMSDGHSPVYSEVYANSIVSGHNSEFSHEKAKIYEELILAGNKEEYAEYASDKLAEELIEADMRGLIETNMDRDYYTLIAKVRIYVHFNKKEYKEKLYGDIYENEYLNYYFENHLNGSDVIVNDKLEQKVSEMYLKRINSKGIF